MCLVTLSISVVLYRDAPARLLELYDYAVKYFTYLPVALCKNRIRLKPFLFEPHFLLPFTRACGVHTRRKPRSMKLFGIALFAQGPLEFY